ncbi:MAG TPA: imidazole glycerol phosphate synthase subunit HisH, partial [Bryobacteraceae bacterium]|nr:imidazole glycerol phosphate synthase subunit HisH [Bryobacteraceae bacterium]
LGVCLGMQLLSEGSEEGRAAGLGLVAGRCVKFRFDLPRSLKVPHMGWNTVRPVHPNPLVDASEGPRFYFVHSYHVVCERPEEVLATSHYGYDFTSMLNRGNVWGAQFHPEKSHRFGMAMLRRFASL